MRLGDGRTRFVDLRSHTGVPQAEADIVAPVPTLPSADATRLSALTSQVLGDAVRAEQERLAEQARSILEAPLPSVDLSVFGNLTGGTAVGSPQDIVRSLATARYGWTGSQWRALSNIVQRESGWNPAAANRRSSARGLFQKMTSLHGPLEPTVAGQARWGLEYIRRRYSSPSKAWAFWQRHRWY